MTEIYRIRPATPDDAVAISALSQDVFRRTFVDEFAIGYAPEDLAAFLERSHGEDNFRRRIAETLVIVAESQGEIWGYAAAGPVEAPHPEVSDGDVELHRLYVDFARHGQGVAGALMAAVLAAVDPRHDRTVWLGVWSGNIRAQRFYARYGFNKVGEYDYPVGKTIDREFILRRTPKGA